MRKVIDRRDAEGTDDLDADLRAALSPVLARMKREWQAEALRGAAERFDAARDDMRTWCGPYGHPGVPEAIDRREAHLRRALRAEASGREGDSE